MLGVGELRAWTPNDSKDCGGFGIKIGDANCGAFDSSSSNCCTLDRAVLPLYEVFCNGPEVLLQEIEGVCNNPFQGGLGLNMFNIDLTRRICGELKGPYTTSKTVKALRETRLLEIAGQLNQLLDQLVPSTPIITSAHYMQVSDPPFS